MGIYGMNGCGSCGSSAPHLPIMQGMQANPAGQPHWKIENWGDGRGPKNLYGWIVVVSNVPGMSSGGGGWPVRRVRDKADGRAFIAFAKKHGIQEATWEWSRLEADREWTERQQRDSHLSNPATPYCDGSATCSCVSCDYHRGGSGGRGRVVKTRAQEEAEWKAGAAGREQAYYQWLADRNRAVAAGQVPPPWSPAYYAENPGILGTIGASLVTGIGLGLGNQVAAHAYGRATGFGVQQNPEQLVVEHSPRDSWSLDVYPRGRWTVSTTSGQPLIVFNSEKKARDFILKVNEIGLRPALDKAYGRTNPHLLVINPHGGDSVLAAIEQVEGRSLKPAERKLLKRAIREFTEFHGRPPVPEDLVQVKAPPHAGPFLVGIGEAMNVDYAVPGDFNSAREGLWTHKAGDHGRKKNTRPPYLAAIPGQKVPPVFVEPSGANMYFKPSHGVMG